ncbi:hypothetical protein GDO86_003631 [Hymenochirus boettgeri]|uniref:Uncharacterized protein n=1 Tax=Hymenochirus boettgeri TaxID=247094 RepID=A0A8T2K6N4_9PIPI|nr:hypothetical protein GDO86_003631 [Hymenochirus boettgeri]
MKQQNSYLGLGHTSTICVQFFSNIGKAATHRNCTILSGLRLRIHLQYAITCDNHFYAQSHAISHLKRRNANTRKLHVNHTCNRV